MCLWNPANASYLSPEYIQRVQTERKKGAALAWLAAWAVTALLIGVVHYESRDPDSQLYAGISARLVREPMVQWIAPQWWGFWNSEGPYCEHPVGMFVVPALLGRAGYPPLQAAYAVNALYQVASFALVTLIAARLVPRSAVALGCILQLLPIAFVFRVRANQEYRRARRIALRDLRDGARAHAAAMDCGYAGRLLRRPARQGRVRLHGARCVRNLAGESRGLERTTACGLGRVVRLGSDACRGVHRDRRIRSGIREGDGTLLFGDLQEPPVARGRTRSGFPRLASRVHGELVRREDHLVSVSVEPHSGRGCGRLRAARSVVASQERGRELGERTAGWQGAWFAIVTALALTATFSVAHRKADRYIFPVYFLVAAAGAGAAMHRSEVMRRIADKLDLQWMPAALYLSPGPSYSDFERSASRGHASGEAEPYFGLCWR